jgi:hypothetical protein
MPLDIHQIDLLFGAGTSHITKCGKATFGVVLMTIFDFNQSKPVAWILYPTIVPP